MSVKIIEKTGGDKVGIEIEGNKVTLGDDEMTLNLGKYERDDAVHIDICLNLFGFLTFGVSDRYAVQIDIPAREYEYIDTGEKDENGAPRMEKNAKAFDINRVEITLWGKEGGVTNEQ